ncbi:sigma-70 family RNA polymerase sigma factor [Microbacterium radiodurans]|uniref:Sigma-70 family RNA polymerase sigma factor n=1 Tax=Microbacterium radiodurans TaxID=661398 RepID=A0A5J5INQ1_9MICO|nr:sigma-70 family RNA polymerase sigma factor [Microbacterium radiodurans]KAA9083775.1 sigma-70 family RNA polymerase sigma factor [Microbacterium radiodurans]
MSEVIAAAPEGVDLGALMARVAEGDCAAFAQLYDATSRAAFGLALRVTNSHHLAEEVVQEVFLQVWKDAASFDLAKGRPKSWILMLTHRRAVDCVRAVRAATDRDLADGARVAATPGADIIDELHLRRQVDELRLHMSTLSEAQQQVLALAYFSGHTQAEIAAMMGQPLGTIKSRMRDAITRLRKATPASAA